MTISLGRLPQILVVSKMGKFSKEKLEVTTNDYVDAIRTAGGAVFKARPYVNHPRPCLLDCRTLTFQWSHSNFPLEHHVRFAWRILSCLAALNCDKQIRIVPVPHLFRPTFREVQPIKTVFSTLVTEASLHAEIGTNLLSGCSRGLLPGCPVDSVSLTPLRPNCHSPT